MFHCFSDNFFGALAPHTETETTPIEPETRGEGENEGVISSAHQRLTPKRKPLLSNLKQEGMERMGRLTREGKPLEVKLGLIYSVVDLLWRGRF